MRTINIDSEALDELWQEFLVLDVVIDGVTTETSNLQDDKMLGITVQQIRFKNLLTDFINNSADANALVGKNAICGSQLASGLFLRRAKSELRIAII